MLKSNKKSLYILLLLLFFEIGYADYSAFSELKEQVALLQAKVDRVTESNALKTEGAVTGSGYPNISDPKNFYLFIEPMVMHAKVDGTTYAYTATGPANTSPIRADSRDVKFHWDWGLRTGVAYHFPKKDWTIEASYTWIETQGYTKASSNILGSVMPLKGVIHLGSGVQWASSSVSVNQDTILGVIKKSYFVSPTVSLTPYGGLKNSWINLKQWTQYFGGESLSNNVMHINDKNHFWGIGPSIGSGADFYLGKGFSFIGDFQLAFQYGLFRIEYDEAQSNLTSNRIKLEESRHQFAPNFEMNLGVKWGSYFNNNHNYFSFSAGYQMQYWFRMNQIINVLQANAQRYINIAEDISYVGFIMSAKLTF
ncbi:MAG: Lpg1974 family pore-forming outer membrane protein [Rhabdochlamydiaceae bacterium]|nr:Lpg1974 family pore-forming outer membrane protein [Candidatus Amphrikana amoebophyrae]